MKTLIQKYFQRGQLVDLIYLSKTGETSKRRVKILSLQSDSFNGYCFQRNAKRTFLIENVLALVPVNLQERKVN